MAKDRIFIPGLEPDARRVISAKLAELDDAIAALQRKAGRGGVVNTDTSASVGEFLNIEGKSSELITIVLPESTTARRNARITLAFRNTNDVRIVAVAGTVNGAAFVVNNQVGTFDAVADGLGGWGLQLGLTASGPSGGALDAEYVLGAAHAALPNGRVATDSTEIDAVLTTPNVVSWALNAASVALSKLANLTGLSVLGRAANSAGVMAAITSTAARQTLRNNDAGTALEWGFPVEIRDDTVDQGDAYALNFGTGISATVAAGVATLNGVNPGWDDVLAVDATCGANNPVISTSQYIHLTNVGAAIPATGHIRAPTGVNMHLHSNSGIILESENSSAIRLQADGATGTIIGLSSGTTEFQVGGVPRLTFNTNGSWLVNNTSTGTAGQYLRSGGSTTNPQWASIAITEFPAVAANTVIANATAGSAVPTAVAVAADSVLARVGGNLVSHPWATLAGGGLTYSAGVMAVGAGSSMSVTASAVDYAGNTAEIVNSTATGNLGTVDISALTCGGTYRVSAASSAFSIEGFTAKTVGFWFYFLNQDLDVCTLFHEDATATATNRLNLPTGTDMIRVNEGPNGIFFYSGDRWNWVGGSPTRIASGTATFVDASADTIEIQTSANDVNIKAGSTAPSGSGQVNVTSGGNTTIRSGEDIVLEHEGSDFVVIQSEDDTGGFLAVEEASSSLPTVAAGHGMYWVRNDAPTTPMFTDDTNVDHELVARDDISVDSEVTIAGATGNLGTIDISTLTCGGCVRVSNATAAYEIEGFTAKAEGFWFIFSGSNDAQNCTLSHEDGTATAADRLRVNGRASAVLQGPQAMCYYRNSRWRVTV